MKQFSFILILLLILSCSKTNDKIYVVISHTRLNDNSGIDSIVAKADLSKYDVIMLGGDMANLSSYNDSILKYLDKIFDISNQHTLWSLGNHDYTNLPILQKYTNKNTYYSYKDDNTLFIVLDTQKDSSQIIGEQLDFFNNTIDTTSNYDNLVILTHKLIWMRNHSKLEPMIDSVSNGHKGDCSYCVQSNNFYTDIYPKIKQIKQSGKQVYCIAGDIGFNTKKFEYKTKDNIFYLASGIKANTPNNYFLYFFYENKRLNYVFKPIEEL